MMGAWRGGPAPSSVFGSIDGKAGCPDVDRDGRDAPRAGSHPRACIPRIRPLGLIRATLIAVLAALVYSGAAQAYTCPATPIETRIEGAGAVFVGRSTGFVPIAGAGIPQRLYHFKIDQEVKGDLGSTVSVRVPVKPENGGQAIPEDTAAGILMNRANGTWFTTRCGITDPGVVLAGVDKPKGNAIRLLIGVFILGAVLLYSIRRVRRRDPWSNLR